MNSHEITQLRKMIAQECEAIKSGAPEQYSSDKKHHLLDTQMQRLDTYCARLADYLGEQVANDILCELYIQVIG